MNYTEIKDRLGYCGLYCAKCYAYSDGNIKYLSEKLMESLGDFDIYASRFAKLLNEPIFLKYSDFNKLLRYFSETNCKGCRKENCKIFKDCKVRKCAEVRNVDFCFQCSDFPCHNNGFDQHLQKRWIDINLKMKEIGVEKYFAEIKEKPRY